MRGSSPHPLGPPKEARCQGDALRPVAVHGPLRGGPPLPLRPRVPRAPDRGPSPQCVGPWGGEGSPPTTVVFPERMKQRVWGEGRARGPGVFASGGGGSVAVDVCCGCWLDCIYTSVIWPMCDRSRLRAPYVWCLLQFSPSNIHSFRTPCHSSPNSCSPFTPFNFFPTLIKITAPNFPQRYALASQGGRHHRPSSQADLSSPPRRIPTPPPSGPSAVTAAGGGRPMVTPHRSLRLLCPPARPGCSSFNAHIFNGMFHL